MKVKLLSLLMVLISFTGCNVKKEVSSALALRKCEYKYSSISSLKLSGIDITNGPSLLQIPQLMLLFSDKTPSSMPLNFTLNVDVKNPNGTAAAFHGMQYIISLDDIELTTGNVTQTFSVAPGATQQLPIQIGVDLVSLLQNQSIHSFAKVAMNFVGLGAEKSKVTVQLKPTFNIGGLPVTSPIYFPIQFSFGGKKGA